MSKSAGSSASHAADATDLYALAVGIVQEYQLASVALIQRHLKLGYTEALRLMEAMVKAGFVSEEIAEDGYRQILKN